MNTKATSTNSTTGESTNTAELLAAVDTQINQNEQFAVAVVAKVGSKASKGREIWDRVMAENGGDFSKMVRKDMIDLLVLEAKCTKTGAATYYQNMKDSGGYVTHKTA
jgi:hypothetical protein